MFWGVSKNIAPIGLFSIATKLLHMNCIRVNNLLISKVINSLIVILDCSVIFFIIESNIGNNKIRFALVFNIYYVQLVIEKLRE